MQCCSDNVGIHRKSIDLTKSVFGHSIEGALVSTCIKNHDETEFLLMLKSTHIQYISICRCLLNKYGTILCTGISTKYQGLLRLSMFVFSPLAPTLPMASFLLCFYALIVVPAKWNTLKLFLIILVLKLVSPIFWNPSRAASRHPQSVEVIGFCFFLLFALEAKF